MGAESLFFFFVISAHLGTASCIGPHSVPMLLKSRRILSAYTQRHRLNPMDPRPPEEGGHHLSVLLELVQDVKSVYPLKFSPISCLRFGQDAGFLLVIEL